MKILLCHMGLHLKPYVSKLEIEQRTGYTFNGREIFMDTHTVSCDLCKKEVKEDIDLYIADDLGVLTSSGLTFNKKINKRLILGV